MVERSIPRASALARALIRLRRSCSTVPSSNPRAAEARSALLAAVNADPERRSIRWTTRVPCVARIALPTAAARRASVSAGSTSAHCPPTSATFMDRDNSPLSNASRTAIQTSTATLRCASDVEAPMCGVSRTFGSVLSGWSAASGSFSYASTTAPKRRPLASASSSAFSSTMPPRAMFTTIDCLGSRASSRLPIMPFVSSVSGV